MDDAPGLERVEYLRAVEVQEDLVRRRAEGDLPDLVWYLEHPPVVTWGARGGLDHLRLDSRELEARGVGLERSGRGGDVTFHGPGQLVGYPIVALGEDRDLHRYLRQLEEGLLLALSDLGVEAGRWPGRTGVWVGREKIAAIGVRVSRWITSHGFALNVDLDLSGFELIVPCGLADAGVTSLARELARSGRSCPGLLEAARAVHRRLEESLERPLRFVLRVP